MCYVRADYGIVKCVTSETGDTCMPTPEWSRLSSVAVSVILFYAVLLPGGFFCMLYRERHLLREGLETSRTRALAFLHKQYKPRFWYYELVEMGRKVYLVGFAVFLPPGSLIQLIWSLLPAICMLVVEMMAAPKQQQGYVSIAVHLSTIFTLLMIIVLQTSSLVQNLEQSSTDVQDSIWSFLHFELEQTLVILFLSVGTVVGVVLWFLIDGIRRTSRETLPRVKTLSGKDAMLRRLTNLDYHLHMSHAKSGRRQVAAAAQMLREGMPGIRLFEDLDNLAEVKRGIEAEVRASQTMLIFVSRGYFASKRCLREFVCAVQLEQQRKYFAVFFACETDRAAGALTLAEACEEFELACRKADEATRAAHEQAKAAESAGGGAEAGGGGSASVDGVGSATPPVETWPLPEDEVSRAYLKEQIKKKIRAAHNGTDGTLWYEKKAHQQSSLLQIAEHVVEEADVRVGLVTSGGALNEQLKLPNGALEGFHVYCSPNNAGAFDFVYDELRHQFKGQLRIASHAKDIVKTASSGAAAALSAPDVDWPTAASVAVGEGVCARLWRCITACCRCCATRRGRSRRSSNGDDRISDGGGRGSDGGGGGGEGGSPTGPCVFLLYLDARTWTSSRCDLLTEELLLQLAVARERETKPAILLLHECDTSVKSRHAISFERFWDLDQTPPELIKAGLYDLEVIRLDREPYRKLSLLEAAERVLRLLNAPSHFSSVRSRWVARAAPAPVLGAGSAPAVINVFVSSRVYGLDISGADDLTNDMAAAAATTYHLGLNPIVSEFRVSRRKPKEGPAEDTRQRPAFETADVGRRLVIEVRPRKRVRVGKIERRVIWSKRVKRSDGEMKAKNTSGKAHQLEQYKWAEWQPLPSGTEKLEDAEILSVETSDSGKGEKVGGAVTVRLASGGVHSFPNPERSVGGLSVVSKEDLSSSAEVHGHTSGAKQMADQLGDLVDETKFCVPRPPVRGAKSDIAGREMIAMACLDLPLQMMREVKNARYLWRTRLLVETGQEQKKKGQHHVGGGKTRRGNTRSPTLTHTAATTPLMHDALPAPKSRPRPHAQLNFRIPPSQGRHDDQSNSTPFNKRLPALAKSMSARGDMRDHSRVSNSITTAGPVSEDRGILRRSHMHDQ